MMKPMDQNREVNRDGRHGIGRAVCFITCFRVVAQDAVGHILTDCTVRGEVLVAGVALFLIYDLAPVCRFALPRFTSKLSFLSSPAKTGESRNEKLKVFIFTIGCVIKMKNGMLNGTF